MERTGGRFSERTNELQRRKEDAEARPGRRERDVVREKVEKKEETQGL